MCGIIGILLAETDVTVTTPPHLTINHDVNQMLFDGLTVLQHRGQDAAGIVTASCTNSTTTNSTTTTTTTTTTSTTTPLKKWRLHLRKDNGLVKDVFQQHHMLELRGHVGLGHCRYPTAGSSSCSAEAQPLYTNYPYGICVAHNGNITNTEQLASYLHDQYDRHVNTDSDSELLLNLFAEQLTQQTRHMNITKSSASSSSAASTTTTNPTNGKSCGGDGGGGGSSNNTQTMQNAIFAAMTQVMEKCHGGYAGLYLINGYGLVGFRDPHGIRPLVFGCRKAESTTTTATTTTMSMRSNTQYLNSTSRNSSMASIVDVLDEEGIPMTPKNMEHVAHQLDYCICSESVALDTLGFKLIRYVQLHGVLCQRITLFSVFD
jgi:amidophosphoribosyltransferase